MISESRSIARFMKDINIVDDNLQYKTNLRDCYIAYKRLNKDLFRNKLPRIRIQLKRLHGSWGECVDDGKCVIRLCKKFKNKQFFLMVLAHEMVHVYQSFYETDGMNHGHTFNKWRPKFARFCIPLSETYKPSSVTWHAQRNFTQIIRR